MTEWIRERSHVRFPRGIADEIEDPEISGSIVPSAVAGGRLSL
jgi:hypothetical protein